MAASFAFDPDFHAKQEAYEKAVSARPMVDCKGETNMEEHMMKGGFIERKEKPMKDDEFHLLLQEEAAQIDRNDYKSVEQLEDEQADDDTIEHYRRKRRLELLQSRKPKANGGFKEIMGEMFEGEITNHVGPSVMLLYKYEHEESELMSRILKNLAEKFEHVRFRKLLGTVAVKDFPPEQCPTVMVYENGRMVSQFVTLASFAGLKTNEDVVEWCLGQLDILTTDLEQDPRQSAALKFSMRRNYVDKASSRRRDDVDSDDDSDW